jgi:subtilisin
VAGSADALDNGDYVVGVSTAAELVAIKVLDGCGSGAYSDIAAGLNHAADVGCDVANMSLGGSQSSTVADAVAYAHNQGVLLVGSAGNSGPCSDCVGYPAAEPEVLAVSATSKDDSLADFSSTGPEVEVAAPGDNIPSTVPPESSPDGLASFSGTSMSAPHVAGAGGQLMDNGYTNTEARTHLKETAEDIGLGSNEQGSGLLDVGAAVDTSGDTAAAPTVDSLSASEVETSDADAEFDVSWSVSDADGDLSSVDLTLTQDSDGTTEDSASVAVSGDTASGTTRLVAADDDGSGNGYTVDLTVTDSGGRTDSGSTAVSETEETESDPVVDSLSASEVETSDGDAEFDASWSVSDADGNLDSVDLTLTQDSDGSTEDSVSVAVSGSSASGTTRLVAAGDDGSGNTYTVTATVTDGAGGTGTATTSVSETESTNTAPSAAIDSVSANSNPAWNRYTVGWSASDSDGNLSTVTVELRDSSGGVLDSVSTSVSGSSATGSDEVRSKSTAASVAVIATDTAGASDTATQSV